MILVLVGIALAIYSIAIGRLLLKKQNDLAKDVKGNFYKGLKVLALFPVGIFAVILIPLLVIVYLPDKYSMNTDKRGVLLLISYVPSGLYLLYYKFSLVKQNEKSK